MNKLNIVCCIMFKNEEEILERCFKSVLSITDKFVVLDTGSTDSSIEIAKKYTEHVYETNFENFVDTKNYLLNIVETQHNFDMIIWMDADEYFLENQILDFKLNLENLRENISVVLTDINDVNQNDNVLNEYARPRAWRTGKNIRFDGPGVHEYISYNYNDVYLKNIKIQHKHKTKNKDYKAITDNYLKILHAHEEKDPSNPRCLFYLARTYYDRNQNYEACRYYQMYRDSCDNIGYIFLDEYWTTWIEEGRAWKREGAYKNAKKCFNEAIQCMPERAEGYLELANLEFYELNNPWKSYNVAIKAVDLKILDSFIMFTDKYCYPHKILDILTLACWHTHRMQEGLKYTEMLLELEDLDLYTDRKRIENNLQFFKMNKNYKPIVNYDINKYFDNIFCINLEKRPDRKERLEKQLIDTKLNVEWFRGYDGDILKPFIDSNVLVRRTGGYLGCLLSHLEVIKISYRRGYERVLILEDDISIHKNLHEEFNKIANNIVNQNLDWDVLYLGHATFTSDYQIGIEDRSWQPIINEKYENQVVETVNSWTCHARALNRKAMKAILDYYETYGYHYELDRMLVSEFQREKKLKFYRTYPQLFVQNDTQSDNDPSGMSANHFERFLNIAYSKKENYYY